MKYVILYVCDPKKNTQCAKHGCGHNPKATRGACSMTSHVEFKMAGTEPIKFNKGGRLRD